MATAEQLKQGDTVLWFESKSAKLVPFKVIEAREFSPLGVRRIHLYLKSPLGTKITWSGPPTAEIQIPTEVRP